MIRFIQLDIREKSGGRHDGALVAARELEKCATECERLSHRSRWVRAAINGAPMETCQYAAAIRSRLEVK